TQIFSLAEGTCACGSRAPTLCQEPRQSFARVRRERYSKRRPTGANLAPRIDCIDATGVRIKEVAMNVVLVMFRENGERRSFSLTRDVTVIGRREDADFRIPLSDVSRKHSRLIKDGDTLLIEDLG